MEDSIVKIKRDMNEWEYERLKNILIGLKESAKYVCLYENNRFDKERRNIAESCKNEILYTLIELEFE